KQQLTILQQEANTALAGQVTMSKSTLLAQLVAAENALSVLEDTLNTSVVHDAIIRSSPGEDNQIESQKQVVLQAIIGVRTQTTAAADYQGVLQALQAGQAVLTQA